jgi:predicted transcriptional regulator
MSKEVEDGRYVVVTDDGECSYILDNIKDIQEFVEINQHQWKENEVQIYKLIPCEYTIETKLIVSKR